MILLLGHLEAIIRLLINFNIVVSWTIGRPKERIRDGGMAGWCSSQDTHIYKLHLLSSMGVVHGFLKQLQQ